MRCTKGQLLTLPLGDDIDKSSWYFRAGYVYSDSQWNSGWRNSGRSVTSIFPFFIAANFLDRIFSYQALDEFWLFGLSSG